METKKKQNLKLFAFTLAEVLIVLGIMGIIAEMTIPTLIQNTQNKTTLVQLQKVYDDLNQAYTSSQLDNGTPASWFTGSSGGSESDMEAMLNKLKPYLRVTKDCIAYGATGCFVNGTTNVYHYLDKSDAGGYDGNMNAITLADGAIISTYGIYYPKCNSAAQGQSFGNTTALQNVCGYYLTDVNGQKSPNTWGKDIFLFYLTNNGIVPFGTPADTVFTFTGRCLGSTGYGCTAWALYNRNIDYTKSCGSTLSWNNPISCN